MRIRETTQNPTLKILNDTTTETWIGTRLEQRQ